MIPLFANYSQTAETDVPVPPAFAVHYIIAPIFKVYAKRTLAAGGVPPDYAITSLDRTVQHNEDVGGAADSAHLFGVALDIAGSPDTLSAIKNAWPGTVISYDDHIHINSPRAFAWEILRYAAAAALAAGVLSWMTLGGRDGT